MKALYDHQATAMDRLRDSLRVGRRRPILQAPTGWGKTVVGSHIIESARAKSKRVMFTVPMITLVDQTVKKFYDEGIARTSA